MELVTSDVLHSESPHPRGQEAASGSAFIRCELMMGELLAVKKFSFSLYCYMVVRDVKSVF